MKIMKSVRLLVTFLVCTFGFSNLAAACGCPDSGLSAVVDVGLDAKISNAASVAKMTIETQRDAAPPKSGASSEKSGGDRKIELESDGATDF